MPNFIIVGAAKSGTTSLAKYLNQHPDIFIPEKKELRYFVKNTLLSVSRKDPSFNYIRKSSVFDFSVYLSYFNGRFEKMLGEASVHYLYNYEEAIKRIKRRLGDVKIIVVLREPVSRAVSNWKYQDKDFLPFKESVLMEEKRMSVGYNSFWFYKSQGFYGRQVEAYINAFDDVKIVIYDDFVNDPLNVVLDLYAFLGVDCEFMPDTKIRYNQTNVSIVPSNKLLRSVMNNQSVVDMFKYMYRKKLIDEKFYFQKDELVDFEFLKTMRDLYRKDVHLLETLLGVSLLKWFK
ncbi:sulfotransferase family protein [Prosthecochloris sp. SCSIO W1103]|uniref:sulfotransferase family protein n=1 Tax=Prosthecochloris sp. SCSIO W1103 TaxID=2992244 RepID=UPI00223D56E1|nr:sulfotransferase [Prosthecochloris sp. SCSIO W1103]UZJ38143.1 sulfotransferase [Prosthecochloris sp. SCSIO W1103]